MRSNSPASERPMVGMSSSRASGAPRCASVACWNDRTISSMLSISVPSRSKRMARGSSRFGVRGSGSDAWGSTAEISSSNFEPRTSNPLFKEVLEPLGAGGVAEFAEGLRLDLPDALAGHAELAAHFLQRAAVAVVQPEAEDEHLPLAVGEHIQHLVHLLAQQPGGRAVLRRDGERVRDEVAEVAVLLLADRHLQRDGLLRNLDDLAQPLRRDLHHLRDP